MLADLAGSESAGRTNESGNARRREARTINQSLLALGQVISALSEQKKSDHVPYRDSKLTRLLQDSLGGTAATVLIACVAPTLASREETLSTLRYADRAKQIKNAAKVNIDPTEALINNLKAENERMMASQSVCVTLRTPKTGITSAAMARTSMSARSWAGIS